jgi:adenylate cyclase
MMGRDEEAVDAANRAIRLSPFDPLNFGPEGCLSVVHFHNGRFAEAAEAAWRSIRSNPNFGFGHAMLSASYVRLGRLEEAKGFVRHLLQIQPKYRAASVANSPSGGASRVKTILTALHDAGLPD